ncbi:hypothetical protein EV651_12099 [Kribbella sp. VKM Ac-2571]|uniref:DUF4097 family beta strand repeat-containing protein n=1 Tax=Kribbella sp. VKM Ac-2571 TaxID=2512222 RepID=UPI00105B6FD2|nr:DUF4097 family beta strand repeat-containing protein [Kribbella sp. VKM Ac-2571]TDO50415.1 hypothetical protein EV651_12099 [Kribbella sp. VKM Ac-2571]
MTTAQRRMLIIGLVPVLVLVITGAALTVSLIRGKLPYDYSASFTPGPQGVKVVSGVQMQLLASTDGQVHVTVDGTYAAAQPAVNVSTASGVVDIETTCPDVHCDVELTVEVPSSAAVHAKAEGSSMAAVGVASPLTVEATDASVALTRVRSRRVSVDAVHGSIDMLFDSAPDQVNATTSDGSLTVQLPRTATYAIDALAAQGSTQVDVPNDSSSSNRLYLRTSYGSITVQ